MNREKIKLIKEQYQKGLRIKLINMEGENLPEGAKGTVEFADDIGQIHVAWDNGSSLALNIEKDSFELLHIKTIKYHVPLSVREETEWYEMDDLEVNELNVKIVNESIQESLSDEGYQGLARYCDPSLKDKVESIKPSVEFVDGEVIGVITVEINSDLNEGELMLLENEISGQLSDGWGEGFEQQALEQDGKQIYVSFYTPNAGYNLKRIEDELKAEHEKKEFSFFAKFVSKDPRIDVSSVIVEKVVELSDENYKEFCNELLKEHYFLEDNHDLMRVDGRGVAHCLLVKGQNTIDGTLVNSEGSNYARSVSYLPDARGIIGNLKHQQVQFESEVNDPMIRVVLVLPNQKPFEVFMKNELEDMQRVVGGFIEEVRLNDRMSVICNEEGKLMQLPGNRKVGNDAIAGAFFIVGTNEGEHFVSLSDEQIEEALNRFEQIESISQSELEPFMMVRM